MCMHSWLDHVAFLINPNNGIINLKELTIITLSSCINKTNIINVSYLLAHYSIFEQELIEPKFNRPTTSHDHQTKMTEGGFKLVCKSGKSSRTFTNSSLRFNQQADGSLKTVNRHDRSNKFCSVFVSNLTTETKSADVVSFLHKKHNRQFKVVQIPSKFNDCVSFKVVVPVGMKDTMLDKRNWTKNVYVREFFENSRGLANLSAKY